MNIILKLDDYALLSGGTYPNWSRCVDDLIARGLHASVGVIGERCVSPSAAALTYVQNAASNGIEFWGHGWTHSAVYEFKGRTVEYQTASIQETARLMEQVYAINCISFGAPYNEVEIRTGYAVKESGVQIWLFPKWGQGLEQAMPIPYLSRGGGEIETGTGVPSLTYLQSTFDNTRDYVCLQAHPNSFANEATWTEWNACLNWLVAQGGVFKTPKEYFGL